MKTYHCVCGQLLFFENVTCVQCHRELGFLPDVGLLSSLDLAGSDNPAAYRSTAPEAQATTYKKCGNYVNQQVCNWMLPHDAQEVFCISCQLDEIIPDLTLPANVTRWAQIEAAKRRLVYSLLEFKLPLLNRKEDPKHGLGFQFLADIPGSKGPVLTGHDEGIITLNIAEADDAEREKRRVNMHEPYRTLLGHFRHEIGHYYWDRLVRDTPQLEPFRALFGDERADYAAALQRYYQNGAAPDWQTRSISPYSTAHPWEDWAETWAHYMHIQDTLEVAADFGLVDHRTQLDPTAAPASGFWRRPKHQEFEQVIKAWSRLTIALNSLNRSMGLGDIYPFVLSAPVVKKLEFVSSVISSGHSSSDEPGARLPHVDLAGNRE